MNLEHILSLRPALSERAKRGEDLELSAEPSIGDLLFRYYKDNGGYTYELSQKLMDEYIAELKDMIDRMA